MSYSHYYFVIKFRYIFG